jgi:hypothetical protein
MSRPSVKSKLAPSASGARIGGDDLQHLIAWYWCLVSQHPSSRIVSVQLEADHAGNIDDVVVRRDGASDIFQQIKASVSAEGSAGSDWLMEPSPRGGASILQKLYTSWRDLEQAGADLGLVTSRPIDPEDPILKLLDRRNLLGPNLRRVSPGSKAGKARKAWADHVGCTAEELCSLLDVLQLHLGQTEAEWRSKVADVAMGAGLRFDEVALSAALGEVREWVKTTRTERGPLEITEAISRLDLRAERPWAVVAVQAIDIEPAFDDAFAVLDWIRLFRGDSPKNRRGLIEVERWRDRLPSDLRDIVRRLRDSGERRVLVRGKMRLPTWFAVGAHFSDVAGFDLAATDRGQLWVADMGDGSAANLQILEDDRVGDGDETLLVVAISMDATADAREALAAQEAVGRLLAVTVDGGPNRRLLADAGHAMAAAVAVRDFARSLSRQTSRIHLVLSCPGPFALFLGHLWDRMAPTQLYEDLVNDYEPSFEIRN